MNAQKELTPVRYDDCGLRILKGFLRVSQAQCFTLHWHERMELLRVRRGSFRLYLGEQYAAEVCAGEVAIVPPRQPHTAVASEEGVLYDVLMFEPDAFCNAAPVTTRFLHPLMERRMELLPVSDEITGVFDEIVLLADEHPMQAVGRVYQLLAILMERCIVHVGESSAADRRFSAVVDYVNTHYADALSTATLSSLFGYDEAYFCRCFKKATGLSVLRYVEVLRLEAAQKLLRETDAEISRIAETCGYTDACYFSHRFRKHVGQSPSAFRRALHLSASASAEIWQKTR